ncbi:MAG: glutamine synthetase family protein [Bdellovibrionales bacterium]
MANKQTDRASQIIKKIRDSKFDKIKVAVTDLDGVVRGKYLHKDKFLSAADGGFGFCNVVFGWDSADVCYDNSHYTGWHSGYPDAVAKIDLNTHREIPWENQLHFFLGDFTTDEGKPLPICPRQVLKRVLKIAEDEGYTIKSGMEFEWFNFKETPQSFAQKNCQNPEPITPGMFGYSLLRATLNQPFFTALMDEMLQFGIPLEGLHTETGPGVYEAAILYSDALESADRAVLFKTATKEIAYRFGIMPSFMAKWHAKLPGCSGHIHQSVWDKKGSKNLFFAEKDPHRMSPLFKSYVAGQLRCLPELLPFYAPTVNSYKRLVEGYWAPTKVTWGLDNRTVAFRVIPGSGKSTRVETRISGSDVNPYLAIAASVASGLYGIRKQLALKDTPVQGSAYLAKDAQSLPRNLYEATMRLSESKLARELMGDQFVDHFVNTRLWEWRQFQDSVTNWEMQRYFEII